MRIQLRHRLRFWQAAALSGGKRGIAVASVVTAILGGSVAAVLHWLAGVSWLVAAIVALACVLLFFAEGAYREWDKADSRAREAESALSAAEAAAAVPPTREVKFVEVKDSTDVNVFDNKMYYGGKPPDAAPRLNLTPLGQPRPAASAGQEGNGHDVTPGAVPSDARPELWVRFAHDNVWPGWIGRSTDPGHVAAGSGTSPQLAIALAWEQLESVIGMIFRRVSVQPPHGDTTVDLQVSIVCHVLSQGGVLNDYRSMERFLGHLYRLRRAAEGRPITQLEGYEYEIAAEGAVKILTDAFMALSIARPGPPGGLVSSGDAQD
jgi:hypothetical protein